MCKGDVVAHHVGKCHDAAETDRHVAVNVIARYAGSYVPASVAAFQLARQNLVGILVGLIVDLVRRNGGGIHIVEEILAAGHHTAAHEQNS